MTKEIPTDQHVTYQLQFRKCGKATCHKCKESRGHGPYWYAYWHEGSRLKSGYIGKVHPAQQPSSGGAPVATTSEPAASPLVKKESTDATIALPT